MATSGRKLNLRLEADRSALGESLLQRGIFLAADAIEFAASKLSDDWLSGLELFSIRTARNHSFAISLPVWAELVQSLFDLRGINGIDEQVRRLRTPSHEALDTCLVLQVAGRYRRDGYTISFEPNGKGCSDLLIQNSTFRSYIEIKRENESDHQRFTNIQQRASEILERLDPQLRTWLRERDLRMEVKFSRLFSSGTVVAIVEEIVKRVRACEEGKAWVLNEFSGGSCVLLNRFNEPYHKKGIHKAIIRIEEPGTPVQVVPQNMPIQVIFDWRPNLDALKQRIQRASRQLKNDTAKDPDAQGFFVMEMSDGNAGKEAVVNRHFSSLPVNCLGIVLLANPGFIIPKSNLSTEIVEVMALAANPGIFR